MPFVEVKSIKGVFTTEEKTQIINDITNVFAQMKTTNLRKAHGL
jgi:phenylpyruvate tautomerase PptA (4-oxalocrotonate tautomerase family)